MKRILTFLLLLSCIVCPAKKKPLIGISTGFDYGYQSTVSDGYVVSVLKAGGIPMLLPLQRDSAGTEALMRHLDGVILTGGEDVNPAYYGEDVLNETVGVNPKRDTSDALILRCALRRKMPILGICRGEQFLAVCLGDKLYQDIPTQVPQTIGHFRGSESDQPLHPATIDRSSKLYSLLKTDTIMVNSFHHQAARGLSTKLRVSATSPDGVVEAFESGHNIICVQFHPEKFISEGDDFFLPLFENLVTQAR